MLDHKRIGEILVELQVLTPAEVERVLHALRRRGGQAKFGQLAREMGLLREEHVLAALAVQMELFPRVHEMSLRKLMGRLRDPIRTPASLPVQKARLRLAAKNDRPGKDV